MVVSSSKLLPSSSSTPPIGVKSSSSAAEADGGWLPINLSRGGGAFVSECLNLASKGIRVRVLSRALVYMPSMSSVGRHMRGTPASSYRNLSSKFSRSLSRRLPSIISSSIFARRTPHDFLRRRHRPTSTSSGLASNDRARSVKRLSASLTVLVKIVHIRSQIPVSGDFSPFSVVPRPEPRALNSNPTLSPSLLRTHLSTRVARRRISSRRNRPDTSSRSFLYS